MTSENVGVRFAIVLDGALITAPVIREAITGGSGKYRVALQMKLQIIWQLFLNQVLCLLR